MKTLVVYDSEYGNTRNIAETIASAFSGDEVRLLNAKAAPLYRVDDADLLIIGSPTQAGMPTVPVDEYIQSIPAKDLQGVEVAVFDTRLAIEKQGVFLRALMRLIGYAATKIAHKLQKKGAHLLSKPEGFIVDDKEGPLEKGELEHAINWAHELYQKVHRLNFKLKFSS